MRNKTLLIGYRADILESLCSKLEQPENSLILVDDTKDIKDRLEKYNLKNIEILNFKEGAELVENSKTNYKVYIGVTSTPKKRLFSKNLFGYENVIFPKLIKPTALISGHSSQEKGIFLGDYVTIESNTSIKKFSVIQSHSHIGHDSSIGEFTIFGSSVTITGRCSIGDYCFLGSSVTVIPDTKIGKGSVIQAGSCITKDIPDFSFASGNPCEVICPVELLGKKFNLHNKQLE